MWIIPNNYLLSSRCVADMVASREDLTLPGLNIESSLMWRSKPSPLQTWLRRWKTDSYLPHLFGRILRPCQWSRFEEKLTSSLEAIPVNHFRKQEKERAKTILKDDTCGLISKKSSEQLDLFDAFSRTSKDTSASDLEKSSATWKALVTKQRGEYSQRVKSALLTNESASTSWRTPSATDAEGGHMSPMGGKWKLSDQVHYTYTNGQIDPTSFKKTGKFRTDINPFFLEKLMGVPTGWTALGSWGTESCHKPQQKRGEC